MFILKNFYDGYEVEFRLRIKSLNFFLRSLGVS